jgi:hypothetical protein
LKKSGHRNAGDGSPALFMLLSDSKPGYHHAMPLPPPPTHRPNNAANRLSQNKRDNELLFKGVLCALIGACVLVSPYFILSPDLHGMLVKAALVGWCALLLGCGFVALFMRRRMTGS